MRTIYGKVVAWAVATLIVSTIGFGLTAWYLAASRPPPIDMMLRTMILQREDASEAYREGGEARLESYLKRLDTIFDAEHHLVSGGGRDLVSGRDWSALVSRVPMAPHPPVSFEGRAHVFSPPDSEGRRILVQLRPRFLPGEFAPYFLWIVPLVAVFGYALAVHLGRPIRALQRVVERFGSGDLSARAMSNRRDEIGQLSRAFDQMADRVESLRQAERRLLQDVSHELRSPLARLALAVRLARTGADRDASLDRIQLESNRLGELVGELLELVSAEGHPDSRVEDPVDLAELAIELGDDCRLEADAKQVGLEIRTDGQAMVKGDGRLLRRAMENVLRNSIRHAPESTLVNIRVARGDGRILVEIRDRGPGVPEGALESIFEPFVRVEDDRSRSTGGAGLGLAIAKRAIAVHGGRISARNAEPGLAVVIEVPAV